MKDVLAILDFAMTMEQEGKYFFSEWSGRVRGAAAKELFSELARWEEEHWRYLADRRSTFEKTGKVLPAGDAVYAAEQKAIATFYDRGTGETGQTEVTRCTGDMTAMRLAITIEHDLHDFYTKAAAQTADAGLRDMFAALGKWELGHREILEREYAVLRQQFFAQMGFAPF